MCNKLLFPAKFKSCNERNATRKFFSQKNQTAAVHGKKEEEEEESSRVNWRAKDDDDNSKELKMLQVDEARMSDAFCASLILHSTYPSVSIFAFLHICIRNSHFNFFLRFVFISLSSLLELLFFRLDTQHIWKWKWILIKIIKSEFNENSLATTTRSSRFDFRLRIIANCCLTKNLNLYKKLCERKKNFITTNISTRHFLR